MSLFREPDFERACSVMRGDEVLPAAFTPFANAFEREFIARPLAVGLEVIGPGSSFPRLGVRVWIEGEAVIRHLRSTGEDYVDFMPRLRSVAPGMFAGTTEPAGLAPHVRHGGIDAAELARLPQQVSFWDFEPAAAERVRAALSADDLQRWGESLGLGDELWCVTSMGGAAPVVFVQTAEHAAQLRGPETLEAWRDSYFELARANDEFNCLSPGSCRVEVDSRETFETRYGSSWYEYWH